jgi:hypothetical protein
MSDKQQIGRLAMRHEGEHWNAYYALPDSMDGAIFLGSIKIAAARRNEDIKERFMNLMWEVVADILEEKIGTRPEAIVQLAPDHERAGNG